MSAPDAASSIPPSSLVISSPQTEPFARYDEGTKQFIVKSIIGDIVIHKLDGKDLSDPAIQTATKVVIAQLESRKDLINASLKDLTLTNLKGKNTINYTKDYQEASILQDSDKTEIVKNKKLNLAQDYITSLTKASSTFLDVISKLPKPTDAANVHAGMGAATASAVNTHAHAPDQKESVAAACVPFASPQQLQKDREVIVKVYNKLEEEVFKHLAEFSTKKSIPSLQINMFNQKLTKEIQDAKDNAIQYRKDLEKFRAELSKVQDPTTPHNLAKVDKAIAEISHIITSFEGRTDVNEGLNQKALLEIADYFLREPRNISSKDADKYCKILEPIVKNLKSDDESLIPDKLKENLKHLQDCRDKTTNSKGQLTSKFSYETTPMSLLSIKGAVDKVQNVDLQSRMDESRGIREIMQNGLNNPPPNWNQILSFAAKLRSLEMDIATLSKNSNENTDLIALNALQNKNLMETTLKKLHMSYPDLDKVYIRPKFFESMPSQLLGAKPKAEHTSIAALNYSFAKGFLEQPLVVDPATGNLMENEGMQKAKFYLQSFKKNFPEFYEKQLKTNPLLNLLTTNFGTLLEPSVKISRPPEEQIKMLQNKIEENLKKTPQPWNDILQDFAKLAKFQSSYTKRQKADIDALGAQTIEEIRKSPDIGNKEFEIKQRLFEMSGKSVLPITQGKQYIAFLKLTLTEAVLSTPFNVNKYLEARQMLHELRKTHPNFYQEQLKSDTTFALLAGTSLHPYLEPALVQYLNIIDSTDISHREAEIHQTLLSGNAKEITKLFKENAQEAHAIFQKTLALAALPNPNPHHVETAEKMLANVQNNFAEPALYMLFNQSLVYQELFLNIKYNKFDKLMSDPDLFDSNNPKLIENVINGKFIGLKFTNEKIIEAFKTIKEIVDFSKLFNRDISQKVTDNHQGLKNFIEGNEEYSLIRACQLVKEDKIPTDKIRSVYEGLELIKWQLHDEGAPPGLIKLVEEAQKKLEDSPSVIFINKTAVKTKLNNFIATRPTKEDTKFIDQLSQGKIQESATFRSSIQNLLVKPIPVDRIKRLGALLQKHENDLVTLQENRNGAKSLSLTLNDEIAENHSLNAELRKTILEGYNVDVFDPRTKLEAAKADDLLSPSMKERLLKLNQSPKSARPTPTTPEEREAAELKDLEETMGIQSDLKSIKQPNIPSKPLVYNEFRGVLDNVLEKLNLINDFNTEQTTKKRKLHIEDYTRKVSQYEQMQKSLNTLSNVSLTNFTSEELALLKTYTERLINTVNEHITKNSTEIPKLSQLLSTNTNLRKKVEAYDKLTKEVSSSLVALQKKLSPVAPPNNITDVINARDVPLNRMEQQQAEDVFNHIVGKQGNAKMEEISRRAGMEMMGKIPSQSMLASVLKIANFKDLTSDQAKVFLTGFNAIITDLGISHPKVISNNTPLNGTSIASPLEKEELLKQIQAGRENLERIAKGTP